MTSAYFSALRTTLITSHSGESCVGDRLAPPTLTWIIFDISLVIHPALRGSASKYELGPLAEWLLEQKPESFDRYLMSVLLQLLIISSYSDRELFSQ